MTLEYKFWQICPLSSWFSRVSTKTANFFVLFFQGGYKWLRDSCKKFAVFVETHENQIRKGQIWHNVCSKTMQMQFCQFLVKLFALIHAKYVKLKFDITKEILWRYWDLELYFLLEMSAVVIIRLLFRVLVIFHIS